MKLFKINNSIQGRLHNFIGIMKYLFILVSNNDSCNGSEIYIYFILYNFMKFCC